MVGISLEDGGMVTLGIFRIEEKERSRKSGPYIPSAGWFGIFRGSANASDRLAAPALEFCDARS